MAISTAMGDWPKLFATTILTNSVTSGEMLFYNGNGVRSTNPMNNSILRLSPILDKMTDVFGYRLRLEWAFVEDCLMLYIDGADKAVPLVSRTAIENSKYDDLWFQMVESHIEYAIEMHRTRP